MMMQNLIAMKAWVQIKMNKFLRDERGDVNIVSLVVLMGIAVLLAMIFKDAIGDLLDTLLSSIKGNATNTVTNTLPAVGGGGD